MESTPKTQLETILGAADARACIQEIEDRIHPNDSQSLRSELIKEILDRHIHNRNIPLHELLEFFPDRGKVIGKELRQMLMYRAYDEVISDYVTDEEKFLQSIANE